MEARISPASPTASSDVAPAHEPLFRMLIEHGADAVFLIDLGTEECVYVSPAVRSLLGREPAELIGRHLTEFVHPDDTAEVVARSARRREGRGVRASVTRMAHADGGWVWVQATASPVLIHEGRKVSIFNVAGAAERVRAETGLRTARMRLRRLLVDVTDGEEFLQTRDGSYDLTVEALAAAMELRHDETGNHARRVTDLALALTQEIDPELAGHPELRYGFLLHDIGKIGISDSILLKPTRLDPGELRTIQMHTTLGEHLLSYIPLLSNVAHDVVAYHHERWDGTGYPWGMRGEEIPVAARIFAVADAFDAMVTDRPYRRAISVAEAVIQIEQGSGTQFDPVVVEAFMHLADGLDPDPPDR